MADPRELTLKITLHPEGLVSVEGNLEQRLVMFALCEEAKILVQKWHEEKQSGKQLLVPGRMPLFKGRGN